MILHACMGHVHANSTHQRCNQTSFTVGSRQYEYFSCYRQKRNGVDIWVRVSPRRPPGSGQSWEITAARGRDRGDIRQTVRHRATGGGPLSDPTGRHRSPGGGPVAPTAPAVHKGMRALQRWKCSGVVESSLHAHPLTFTRPLARLPARLPTRPL